MLGAAAACFQRVELRAANLTAAEDGYPYGASRRSRRPRDTAADRRVRPSTRSGQRAHPGARRRAPGAGSDGAVLGQGLRRRALPRSTVGHPPRQRRATTPRRRFRAVVREASRAAPRMHARLDPYDLALAAYFHDPVFDGRHRAPTTSRWRRPCTSTASPSSPRTTTTPPGRGRAARVPVRALRPRNRWSTPTARLAGAVIKAGSLPASGASRAALAARPRRFAARREPVASWTLGGRLSRPGRLCLCKLRGWLILLAIYALERTHRPGRAGGPGGASRWAPTAAGAASPVKLRAAVDLVVPPSVVGGARISQGAKRP